MPPDDLQARCCERSSWQRRACREEDLRHVDVAARLQLLGHARDLAGHWDDPVLVGADERYLIDLDVAHRADRDADQRAQLLQQAPQCRWRGLRIETPWSRH